MQIKQGTFCPLIKDECVQLKCAWFTMVRGTNPNTGKEVDEWQCAVSWLPTLIIDNSNQQRQTGAAVESFRNEMAQTNESHLKVNSLILAAATGTVPPAIENKN